MKSPVFSSSVMAVSSSMVHRLRRLTLNKHSSLFIFSDGSFFFFHCPQVKMLHSKQLQMSWSQPINWLAKGRSALASSKFQTSGLVTLMKKGLWCLGKVVEVRQSGQSYLPSDFILTTASLSPFCCHSLNKFWAEKCTVTPAYNIFSHPITNLLSLQCILMRVLSHASMKKKILNSVKFHAFLVVFKWHHGSERVNKQFLTYVKTYCFM